MKNKKTITGIILLAAGVIVLVLSLAADCIGLGSSPGFGYWQIIGVVAGAVVTVAGLVLLIKK